MMYLTFQQMLLLHQTVSVHSAVDAKRKLKGQWQSINWEKANRLVKSLQRRIVAAIKENRWGKVKALQWILTHSFAAKVLAIRRVTENKGSRTCGVDKQLWNTPQSKWKAIQLLEKKGYKASPVRRVKIPKENGKYRLLGIPTMKDRAMQALYLLALEPIAETTADMHSYGFRRYRSCHDAITQCHIILCRKTAPQYVLEGDIKACFDKISHQYILDNIPVDKNILRKWLKAGYIEKNNWFPSEDGSPQGSIISPTIANMVLDGIANAIDMALNIRSRPKPKGGIPYRDNNPHKVNFVRYADDWIVTANNREVLEKQVKPLIKEFLQPRGLEMSEHKTVITNIHDGFDFLGQHFRKYKNGKLLVKPSKKSVKKLMSKLRLTIKSMYSAPTCALIGRLNSIIKGWAMYHRHCSASETFAKIDNDLWLPIWKWCIRRHPKKSKKWIIKRYFVPYKRYKWILFGKEGKELRYLMKMARTPIKRHVKIRATANPFTREDEPYFEFHLQLRMLNTWRNRKKLAFLFRRQEGKCPICKQRINKESGWNIHHKLERYKGGKDTLNNLVMLHPNCHQQVHFWNIQFDGDVPIWASEFA